MVGINKIIRQSRGLRGTVTVPGDKSISHRAVMIGSIAEGETQIDNFLPGEDCLSTINCFRSMGVRIEGPEDGRVRVFGKGLNGLEEPERVLDAGNSGTTIRLMSGILSGQPFLSLITGDGSLTGRPMGRVINPLLKMGASIWGRRDNTMAPLAIKGGHLKGIDYISPVASAQVKSAVLLAGLFAEGSTYVTEPVKSRDHTERMLNFFGADITVDGKRVGIRGGRPLKAAPVTVPGDISAAAFLMVAASITPGSDITIKNVGINPTRDGIIEALREMGADIVILNTREVGGEPVADIRVRTARLHGTTIEGPLIPRMIDEIPVLAVASAAATGETLVRDAAELKVKESNRIAAVVGEMRKFGVNISELDDGFIVKPGNKLTGAVVNPRLDHRIAMSMTVAGLVSEGPTEIKDAECVNISFPGFYGVLNELDGNIIQPE